MARSYLLALAEEERLRYLKSKLTISRRLLRTQSKPLELPENSFVDHFRLTKSQFLRLCEEVIPLLSKRRRSAVRPEIKILAAIAFYGNGAYQKDIGAFFHLGMSQTTVHDCLREVTDTLNQHRILRKYIKFPKTQEERESVSRRFMDKFQFPGVIGCIDGTHVAIVHPQENEPAYFNKKLYHSLNVLIICDADLRILHVDASIGGSCDDSHIWNQCPVLNFMKQLHDQGDVCWLLGDSGYAQQPWMMTPILHTSPNSPEELYNRRHIETRNVVKRCIEVLKSRWRCLMAHRALRYSPVRVGKFVNACAVLHNLINDPTLPLHSELLEDLDRQIDIPYRPQSDEGRQVVVDMLWQKERNNVVKK